MVLKNYGSMEDHEVLIYRQYIILYYNQIYIYINPNETLKSCGRQIYQVCYVL